MKKYLMSLVILASISITFSYAQTIPEGAVMINENTIIKNENGDRVDMPTLMKMMNSGDWNMEPVSDESGKMLYMQLRKSTEEEKKRMKEMMMHPDASDFVGKKAPEYEMVDLNGNEISSENTKGKVVVLNFWFAACKPCIAELPEINQVYEDFKDHDEVVFASITFEKEEDINTFLKTYSIAYPIIPNGDETIKLFQVNGFPTNIVIDKDGYYFDYLSGGFPDIGAHISHAIKEALK